MNAALQHINLKASESKHDIMKLKGKGEPVSYNDEASKMNKAFDFNAASTPSSLTLFELVRHLARISAEQDYKSFLKTVEKRYSGPQPKGPLS